MRNFTWLHNLFGIHNKSSHAYKVGKFPVHEPLPDHAVITKSAELPRVEVSSLPNGVRILTERAGFPGSVHMGVLIQSGTRDLNVNNAGLMLALKNTYLKTNSRTNEQLNYCIIQMAGGEFSMDYTQEMTYYQGYCLPHDVYDYLQMMSDCVLDEKTLMDEEAAQWRADEFWKLREFNAKQEDLLKELPLTAAYGLTGLGLPLVGFQSGYQNIGYTHMNNFRSTHMTPERMIVCAAGVDSHQDFVNAARPYFEHLDNKKAPPRKPAVYKGGEIRHICESDLTYMSLSFEGVPWGSPDLATIQVLRTAIGDGGGFSAGGPGKGMHSRAYTHILSKYPFIDSIQAVNHSFTDSGVFGINLIGLNAYCGYMTEALVKELTALASLSDVEVNRAKNLLKNSILLTLEKTESRLEDTVKGLVMFGKIPEEKHYYLQMIDAVTPDMVRKLVQKILKSPPSLVVFGGDTHAVPSVDKIASRFK